MPGAPLNILILTTNFPNYPGHGSGQIIFQQAVGLTELGHRVTVLCPSGPGLKKEETLDGVRVFRFSYGPEKQQRIAYDGGIPANLAAHPFLWLLVPGFMLAFIRHCRHLAGDADLIHAHWTPAGFAASFGGRGKPLVLNFHGSDVMTQKPFIKRLARIAARHAALFVAPGENLGRYAVALGVPRDRLRIIHHGIEVDALPAWRKTEPKIVLYVGRLSA